MYTYTYTSLSIYIYICIYIYIYIYTHICTHPSLRNHSKNIKSTRRVQHADISPTSFSTSVTHDGMPRPSVPPTDHR